MHFFFLSLYKTNPELKEKLKRAYNTPFVIKYQLAPEEDLNILVSVKSDEDVQYMLEEYVRQTNSHRFSHFKLYLIPITAASPPLHHLQFSKTQKEKRHSNLNNESRRHNNGCNSNAIANNGSTSFSFARSPLMNKGHSSSNLYAMDYERHQRAPQFQDRCKKHHLFFRINENHAR